MAFLLWLAGMSGVLAYAAVVYQPRRYNAPRITVSAPQEDREPWSGDAYERARDRADEPDVDADFKAARTRFALWEGRRVECPKCSATNAVRRGDYAKSHGVEVPILALVMKFSVRNRDSAIYCHVHDQAFYRMSEDSVMRFTPSDPGNSTERNDRAA